MERTKKQNFFPDFSNSGYSDGEKVGEEQLDGEKNLVKNGNMTKLWKHGFHDSTLH